MERARTKGLVSIVITNYNRAPYLTECLDSLLNQSYPHWEIIFVDDASTDNSVQVVEQWLEQNRGQFTPDQSLLLLPLPRNVGFSGALTTGFFLANGEFIAVQDSDDYSDPQRLQKQVQFLRDHPQIQLVGSNYAYFSDQEPSVKKTASWIKYGDEIARVYANGGHCVCHGTILFHGSLFDQIGGPTRRIGGAEDYEFIVKCLNAKAKIENVPEVLYYYRRHENQRSRIYYGKKRG
ncbi:glycosyltransferase family 2 protein [Brevibacillus fulvus]|uniref:Glycosyltransferase involved in cell wall biosynthesis n=1 Tax=Brevibacillus fulvus TaxID=1125967 RepID=A0A938Y1S5_9BACL|nr:glycosyltransferase family 2 protein [Brevibacillus fulvus]MBM7590421.1 glycosyltransferase involved in cell wall biosynthesis [Brevibacillus fulvus]